MLGSRAGGCWVDAESDENRVAKRRKTAREGGRKEEFQEAEPRRGAVSVASSPACPRRVLL